MSEESLFVAALEKPSGAERRAFLEEACAGDDALRERLVRLLSAHDRTLGILDQMTGPFGWTEGAGAGVVSGAPASEPVGAVIGDRYTLLEEIGVGGMGTVWKAEQTEPVRRIVALKLIRPGMDSGTVLARFESERQALALMDHPNIAKVLDGGTTESGRPFFVMEHVEGVPLTRYCDGARLSIAERLALFLPVCQAVQHAHTKGVIHRDLKPSNILVCQYDGRPVPKVIDFGLAKAVQQPLTEIVPRTANGVLLGTPLYMSPEQAGLNQRDVDTRTDIYALGVILYELLTGTTPLESRRFHQVAIHQMLWLIQEEEPPRPSARLGSSDSLPSLAALRRLEPARLTRLVRGELDWIVMKCLEKDRERRYETASGLARDVQCYLADESVEACPPSLGYRFRKFVRRNRGPVLAVSTTFLLLIAGIAGTTWGLLKADRAWKAEAARADGEKKANETAQKRLRQLERGSQFLEQVFRDLDPRAEEKEGRPLRAILGDRIARQAEQIEGEAIGDPRLAADLLYRLGLTLLHLRMPQRAIPLFEKTRAIRERILGTDHRDTLSSMGALAQGYFDSGDTDRAFPLLEETLRLRRARLGADDGDTLHSMGALASGYKARGMADLAIPLLEETLRLRTAANGADHPETLTCMNNLGVSYIAAKKLDLALPLLERTLELRKARLGEEHTDTLNSMNSLAECYRAARKLDRALPLVEKALTIRRARLGPDDPDTLVSMNNLAAVHMENHKIELAIPLLEEALRLSRTRRGASNPYTLGSMNNLAWTYRKVGKMDRAMPLFLEAAKAIEERGFRDEFADDIVSNLARTQEVLNQFEAAESWRRKWVAVVKEKAGADSLRYAGELGMLGTNLLKQQKWAEAEPVLREALAIIEKKSPASLARCNVQSELGAALLGLAKYELAEPLLVQGYEGLKVREAQIARPDRRRVVESGSLVIRLYEAWGRPEKAAEWRTKLDTASKITTEP